MLEKRGIPAVPVGVENLINTVGMAMMKAHGKQDMPWAVIPQDAANLSFGHQSREEMVVWARVLAPQVVECLTGQRVS